MSNSLYRLLKLAEAVFDSGDEEAIRSVEAYFNSFVKKHCVAHYLPHNNGKTPNPWKRNMDYAGWESSPYRGNLKKFMEMFPGGIADWRKWREKTKKERNQMWSEGPTKGEMGLKKARQERIERITELTGIRKEAKEDMREELSDLEHEQWVKWAKEILKTEDISEDRTKRWKECFVPYNKLSEKMKDFDREWADKVIKIVKKHTDLKKEAADQQVVAYISRALSIPERYLHTLTDIQLKNIKILVDLGKLKEAKDKYVEYQLANRKKTAHYVPEGPDDVKKFEKEPLLYSGKEEAESTEEFIKEHRKWRENDARDIAKNSIKDFISYWKLLLKVPEKRRKKKAELDIKENPKKVNKIRKKIDDLEPFEKSDLEGLYAKDLQALKIALEGRIFELGKCKEDEKTRKGADEILKTNLEYLTDYLEKVKKEMGE